MCIDIFVERIVAPLAGAWIEMINAVFKVRVARVALLAGAWVENIHPAVIVPEARVAPLAGAWIEIIIVVSLF